MLKNPGIADLSQADAEAICAWITLGESFKNYLMINLSNSGWS